MTVSSGVRRTALLLHTLQPADRAALLEQFDADEQLVLQTLLQELSELGIPRDKSLLDETMAGLPAALNLSAGAATTTTAASLRAEVGMEALIAWLDRVSAQQISALLNDESPELIARILACHGWSWSVGVVEQFEPLKRRQIKALSHSLEQLAPRLSLTLLNLLAARLRALPASTAQAMPQQLTWIDKLTRSWRGAGRAASFPRRSA